MTLPGFAGNCAAVQAMPAGAMLTADIHSAFERNRDRLVATSDSRFTSVGTAALERFVRPVCYQDVPNSHLPPALQDANPLGIERLVDGVNTRASLT